MYALYIIALGWASSHALIARFAALGALEPLSTLHQPASALTLSAWVPASRRGAVCWTTERRLDHQGISAGHLHAGESLVMKLYVISVSLTVCESSGSQAAHAHF